MLPVLWQLIVAVAVKKLLAYLV